jgi:hypothetical protein
MKNTCGAKFVQTGILSQGSMLGIISTTQQVEASDVPALESDNDYETELDDGTEIEAA